jgi:hypothetical protein
LEEGRQTDGTHRCHVAGAHSLVQLNQVISRILVGGLLEHVAHDTAVLGVQVVQALLVDGVQGAAAAIKLSFAPQRHVQHLDGPLSELLQVGGDMVQVGGDMVMI